MSSGHTSAQQAPCPATRPLRSTSQDYERAIHACFCSCTCGNPKVRLRGQGFETRDESSTAGHPGRRPRPAPTQERRPQTRQTRNRRAPPRPAPRRPAPPRAAPPPLAARSLRPLRGSRQLPQEAAQALPTRGGAARAPAPPTGPARRSSLRKEAGSAGGRGRERLKGSRPPPGLSGQRHLRALAPALALPWPGGSVSHPLSPIPFTFEMAEWPGRSGPETGPLGIREENEELEGQVPSSSKGSGLGYSAYLWLG